MTPIHIIILITLSFGFRMVYELIKFQYGEKIKKYIEHQKELAQAEEWYKNNRKQVRLNKFREEYYQDIEAVEDGEFDDVIDGIRHTSENVITFELTINKEQ